MDLQIDRILKDELARRCERNPRYSLRSFAKALSISPASLSLLMNAKRPASIRILRKILERLELSPAERDQVRQSAGLVSAAPAENLELERAEKICNWICYAILSLVQTSDFISSEAWIAKRLGISIHEVRSALLALQDAGQLDMSGKSWVCRDPIRINNKVSTSLVRAFQKQLIGKALEALENRPIEERDISSITFAMSPGKIQEAKNEIRKFRLRMSEIFEEPGKSTEVYNLTVQFTPVTRGKA